MHGSTTSLRPRQRTSTSCTECRRRKQKCNQAKDRPCNNCARRYPPVACTYDSGSSSRGSTVERVVDLEGEEVAADAEATPDSGTVANRSYGTTYSASDYPATSGPYSSGSYYVPTQTSTSYWPQQDQTWNGQYTATTSSAYENSYYGSSGASGSGATYDASYYANNYAGYTPQGGYFAPTGDPRAFVGTGTAYDTLNDLPIDSSRRNAELYHFFHQSLAPYLVTIDSKDPPHSFYDKWTPWVVQSPLLATIPLLNASCYQSDARGLEVARSSETIALQSRIISVINRYLRRKKMKEVDLDAVAAVFYLAMNEWYWGDNGSFWAHMKGLKEIIRLRGGFNSMPPDSLLRKQLTLADYQIASSFENELFLHEDPSRDASLIALTTYPTDLESPLLPTSIHFLDIFSAFKLTITIAEMLDEMKFLTSSIRTFQTSRNPPTANDLAKFQASCLWTQNRIISLPEALLDAEDEEAELMYEVIRLASIVYSTSILTSLPLSKSHTPGKIGLFYGKMRRISLSRWKQMPGILLWIVLIIAAAGNEECIQGKKMAERMIHTVAMFVAQRSQEVAVVLMRTFLGVQRWVGGRDERAFEGAGRGKKKAELAIMPAMTIEEDDDDYDESEGGGLGGILGGSGGAAALGNGSCSFTGTIESGNYSPTFLPAPSLP